MITEDYVSFETAKLLHACGFWSDECVAIYDCGNYNEFVRDDAIFQNGAEDYLESEHGEEWKRFGYYLAPTLQMAMKWLRKAHEIFPIILTAGDSQNPFYYWFRIDTVKEGKLEDAIYREDEKEFPTYEQACEAAIIYCLENLI